VGERKKKKTLSPGGEKSGLRALPFRVPTPAERGRGPTENETQEKEERLSGRASEKTKGLCHRKRGGNLSEPQEDGGGEFLLGSEAGNFLSTKKRKKKRTFRIRGGGNATTTKKNKQYSGKEKRSRRLSFFPRFERKERNSTRRKGSFRTELWGENKPWRGNGSTALLRFGGRPSCQKKGREWKGGDAPRT